MLIMGFPHGSVVKNLLANEGDVSSIPGLEDSLEEELATHSCPFLENSMGRRDWWAIVHAFAKDGHD